MLRRSIIRGIFAGILAALSIGCGLRHVTFTRGFMLPATQQLPMDVKRIDVLPVIVGPSSSPFRQNVHAEAIEAKLVESLLETKIYSASVVRNLANDLPNYQEAMAALASQGIVQDDLKNALKQRGTPPDAILTATIWIVPGAANEPAAPSAWGTAAEIAIAVVAGEAKRRGIVMPQPPSAGTQQQPEMVTVSGVFRVVDLKGDALAYFQDQKTVPSGRLSEAAISLPDAFLRKISPLWQSRQFSLFYNSKETESACYILKAVAPVEPTPEEDLKPVQEMLTVRLAKRPNDHCALFLMGFVHELLFDSEKAKEYYNKAIILHPCEEYSQARERVSRTLEQMRKSREEQDQQMRAEEDRKKKQQGKEFKDYKTDRK